LELAGLPAMLISDIRNVEWLTGFTGTFGRVILGQNEGVFLTDSRYSVQAREQVKGFQIEVFASPTTEDEALGKIIRELGISKLGFERSLSFDQWERWTTKLETVQLIPATDFLSQLRLVKSPEEIEKIGRACKLADACMENIQRLLRPGVTESAIGLEIEFYFRKQGAGIAFPVIVASGPNSAKPHGRATERALEVGDFVTLDFGATLDGYNSDITRTFVIGEPSERQQLVYNAVLDAQTAAICALNPGVNGRDVDRLVREKLGLHELDQFFGHGLGHGLGIDVHDGGRLNATTDQPIEVGQVWTVEPGVYIEGFGGVRIEDDVVITEEGAKVLTHFPKQLIALPT